MILRMKQIDFYQPIRVDSKVHGAHLDDEYEMHWVVPSHFIVKSIKTGNIRIAFPANVKSCEPYPEDYERLLEEPQALTIPAALPSPNNPFGVVAVPCSEAELVDLADLGPIREEPPPSAEAMAALAQVAAEVAADDGIGNMAELVDLQDV